MKRPIVGGLALIGALALGIVLAATGFVVFRADGFSARDEPSALEAFIARRLRLASIPSRARDERNPIASSPEVLADARAHYADHCATCHGADGRGQTQMGRNLYPKVPDMRAAETQALSDGQMFFIIENGIRFTGMPAWGHAEGGEGRDSWKLVHLIRRMAEFTARDAEEIRNLMPKGGHQHDEAAPRQHGETGQVRSSRDHDHSHGQGADHP